jgi:hypothetical protein
VTVASDLSFPAGSMLAIIRAPSYDPFGDGARAIHHWIGPCDMPYLTGRGWQLHAERESRAHVVIDIRAPADSDVRKSDWVQLPSGVVVAVVSEPNRPRNPFTGWSPFIHFTVEEVS